MPATTNASGREPAGVREAVAFLDGHLGTRRGHGGQEHVAGQGLLAVGFDHRARPSQEADGRPMGRVWLSSRIGWVLRPQRLRPPERTQQKRLHATVTNETVDAIFEVAMANGASAGKACGAGGGGALVFYASSEGDAVRLRRALTAEKLTE